MFTRAKQWAAVTAVICWFIGELVNEGSGSHAEGAVWWGGTGRWAEGEEMHLKITSFTVTPWALVGRTKGWKSPGTKRSFHSTQLIIVFGKWANFHKRFGEQCIKQACMQSDKAGKQKTVPGRLSVAALYLTVNGLLIPGAPRTGCQLRPKKLGINVGFTDFFFVILTQRGALDATAICAP